MRTWLVLLLLVSGTVQAATVIEDDPGDVGVSALETQTADVPAGVRDGLDILSLEIEEEPATLRFVLTMAASKSPGDDVMADRTLWIRFSHAERAFGIVAAMLFAGQESAWLVETEPDGRFSFLQALDHEVTDGVYTFDVPRASLADVHGAPPTMGSMLNDLRVEANAPYIMNSLASLFVAQGPDSRTLLVHDDAGPVDYALVAGEEQRGKALLGSDRPYRVSNGEATTFVYWVDAANTGSGPAQFRLRVLDTPQAWAVEVPAAPFTLAGGDDLTFPVIVKTAFAHAHGSAASFVLEMTSNRTGDRGALEMGVLYPTIPQPSGHHATLWLGSRSNGDPLHEATVAPAHELLFANGGHEVAYMRAVEDETSLEKPVDFNWCNGRIGTGTERCLEADLEPGLAMGLDFRIGETGVLDLQIGSPGPLVDAELEGRLVRVVAEPGDGPNGAAFPDETITVLADVAPSGAFDLDAGGTTALELDVVPRADADLVAFDPEANLRLVLNLTHEGPSVGVILGEDLEPQLLPGATLRLPLDEYRDPLVALPSLGGDLQLVTNTTERPANPGDVLRFAFELVNKGEADTFDIRLVGTQAEWATLVGDAAVKVRENASGEVIIDVQVPADAAIGVPMDLVVEAASQTDSARRALAQVRVSVVEEEVPDDAALILSQDRGDKKSPGMHWLVGLAALAWTARSLSPHRRR